MELGRQLQVGKRLLVAELQALQHAPARAELEVGFLARDECTGTGCGLVAKLATRLDLAQRHGGGTRLLGGCDTCGGAAHEAA